MYSTDSRNIIQLQAGEDYSLKCGVLDEENELSFISTSTVSWYYKKQATPAIACGGTLSYCDNSSSSANSGSIDNNNNNNSSNRNNNDNGWNLINCDTKPCKSILQLKNVEPERDSGYYKCVIQPNCSDCSRSGEIQFVMTYMLQVMSKKIGKLRLIIV